MFQEAELQKGSPSFEVKHSMSRKFNMARFWRRIGQNCDFMTTCFK